MANATTIAGNFIFRLFGSLPLRLVRAIVLVITPLSARFNSGLRHVTARNVKLVRPLLSEDEQNALVSRSISNTLMTALEMPLIWKKDDTWLNSKIVAVQNDALIKQLVSEQRGVIVICPHVGNWEVIGRKITEYGPTTSLYQPPKISALEDMVRQGRERSGATLVPTNQRGIAMLLKSLRRGEITGILPDQVPKNESGCYAPFFGVPAFTMTLVYNLVQKTGCRVVLGYSIRYQNGFKIIFKPAENAIYSEDKDEAIRALNRIVELSTEEDFCQYQWGYKRFKRQPDNHDPYSA